MSAPIRIVIADDHAPTRAGIRTVLEGDGFEVCGEAASADAAVELALQERPGVQLRQREWEILELLAEGLSTAEIASRLFIAEVTVRTHVSSILKKLRVPTREAAVELLRGR